jgi:hypothetical protein
VLGGAALWFDRTGLLLAPVLLLWWLGLWLLLRGERPFYWQQLAVFAGGYLLAAAPLLVVWLLNPAALPAYWRGGTAEAAMLGDWWFNLRASAATLFWTHDASRVFGYPGPLIPSVVTPLFVLGVGALLLNLDRLLGWCMLTWMGSVLLLAAAASPLAPDWPLLLPLLPAVGVTIVFALERMGALWSQASHEAGSSAAASLAGGLLLAAVVLTWIGYYGFAAGGSAVGGGGIANASATPAASRYAASYTGRALGELAPAGVAVLAASAPEFAVALDDPVLRFAAGSRVNQALAVGVDALPASLPPGSQVFVQGGDRLALSAARARYPGASVAVVRDLQANPQLFVLRLP